MRQVEQAGQVALRVEDFLNLKYCLRSIDLVVPLSSGNLAHVVEVFAWAATMKPGVGSMSAGCRVEN